MNTLKSTYTHIKRYIIGFYFTILHWNIKYWLKKSTKFKIILRNFKPLTLEFIKPAFGNKTLVCKVVKQQAVYSSSFEGP